MDSEDWAKHWPRCSMLVELALGCAASGRVEAGERLMSRIEESRVRMAGAPAPVFSLLSELCFIAWLVVNGDRKAARHHATQATFKARKVGFLLDELQCRAIRSRAADLRQRSSRLQRKVQELLHRSDDLRQRSLAIKERVAPRPANRLEPPLPTLLGGSSHEHR
jgi:hypothetical protein